MIFKTKNDELAIFGQTLTDVRNKLIDFDEIIMQGASWGNKSNKSQLIADNNLYKELSPENASEIVQTLNSIKDGTNSTYKSMDDYLTYLDNKGRGYIKNYVKENQNQIYITDDVIQASKNARQEQLAHNEAIKATTFSAKAGKIALQGLAMAGNMIAMWAISKGIELAIKAIDEYVNAWEHATEAIQEHSSAYEDTKAEIETVSSKIEDLDSQIAELNGLDPITNEEDIANLELEKKILEAQLELLKEKRDLEKEETNKAAEDYFNTKQDSKIYSDVSSYIPTTGDATADMFGALGYYIANGEMGTPTSSTSERVTPEEELQRVIDKIKEYKQEIEGLNEVTDKQEIIDLEAKIADVQTDANTLASTMLENSGSLTDATRKEEIVGLVTEYNNLTDSVNGYTDALNENSSAQQENANKTGISTILGDFNKDVSSYEEAYSKLASAQEEYLKAGSLSADTFAELQENGLLEYLEFTSKGLAINKEKLLENAQASKDKAVADLHAAMMSDMLQIALGNVSGTSEQAQSVIAQLGNNAETAGKQALSSVANWATLGDTINTVMAQAGVEGISVNQKEQMSAVYDYYKNLANSVSAIDITTKTRAGGSSSNSSSSKDTEKVFDFFEERIENINDAISLLDKNLENVAGSLSKNKLISQQIGLNVEKMNNYSDALVMYSEKANSALSSIPENLRDKVVNGAVDLTTFIGEGNDSVTEAIEEYQKWSDKVNECTQELAGLREEIRQLELSRFNNIMDDFTDRFEVHEDAKSLLEAQIDLLKESGKLVGKSFYAQQIEQSKKQLKILEQQKRVLTEQMTNAITSGNVHKGTNEWLEMAKSLNEVDQSIIECKTSIESLDNEILSLHTEIFERIQDRFSNINSELENLGKLFADSDAGLEDGSWTKEGIVQLGILSQQYELARYQVSQYADEIDKLNENYNKGLYSATEYSDRLAELTENQWDAVLSAQDLENAIRELNEQRIDIQIEGIEKEIDSYKELIDQQIEALRTAKNLDDYKKDVSDKNKNVEDLERRIAAMEFDTTASGIAKRKKLEEELVKAKEELEELQHEHSIQMQEDALNKQYENFESEKKDEIETLKDSLDNQEQLIADSLQTVKENSSAIGQEISNIAKEHGITISNAIVSSWQNGQNAIAGYGQTLSVHSSAFLSNLVNVENEVHALQTKADTASASIAEMFSNDADVLEQELLSSYNSIENLNTVAKALKDSLVDTLERGYNVDKLVSGINDVAGAFGKAYKAAKDLGEVEYTGTVSIKSTKGSIKEADPLGATTVYNDRKFAIAKYASGTRSTKGELIVKNEEGFEMPLPKLSNGNYALMAEGSQILSKSQTDNIFKWAKTSPVQFWSNHPPVANLPKIPDVVKRSDSRPVNINNSITFTGAVNNADNFARDIARIADRQVEKSWSKAWDYLQYHG